MASTPIEIKHLEQPWPEGLIPLYQKVWSEAPAYREIFEEAEVEEAIGRLKEFWIAVAGGEIIGFVGGTPLLDDEDKSLISLFDNTAIDLSGVYFISQLGTAIEARRTGLGSRLLNRILCDAKKAGFAYAVLQTTTNPLNDALKLYKNNHFQPLLNKYNQAVARTIMQRRVDNEYASDIRILMLKFL